MSSYGVRSIALDFEIDLKAQGALSRTVLLGPVILNFTEELDVFSVNFTCYTMVTMLITLATKKEGSELITWCDSYFTYLIGGDLARARVEGEEYKV